MKYFNFLLIILVSGASMIYSMQEGQSIKKQNSINSSLLKAAKNFDLEQTINALKAGADINTVDKRGNTPLMRCCIWRLLKWASSYYVQYDLEKQERVVNLLIKSGANLNILNNNNEDALTLAFDFPEFKYCNKTIIDILIQKGANSQNLNEKLGVDYQKKLDELELIIKKDIFCILF